MLRIVLFLLTNIAVVVVASITLSLLGVRGYIDSSGVLDFQALLIFCFVFGMAGSFISLLLSKPMAKWATKTRLIKEGTSNINEARLLETVRQLAQQANIGMPDVGIFPAEQANAFATGWNKNGALVSISQGMLDRYSDGEVRAVLAHEISHVSNGDMITLSLIQGVINTFVMFLARVIGFVVDRVVLKNEEGRGFGYVITVIVCEIVLLILASTILMWFSRKREYAADAGAAYLVGAPYMIAALAHLQRESEMPNEMPKSLNAFGIAEGKREGFSLAKLFMSHPPLEKRIEALQNRAVV
ncbi:MAG: protease HtpX [Helicobacteraceae bacterium]|jgi:heat shock protein HtpX|nr:protease HtpX [Helicobacteraceae bacterium]